MTEKIQLGFKAAIYDDEKHIVNPLEAGEPFYIPKGHIVVTGMTQHGKSTTLEAIFKRDPESKCLVFLTKRGEKTFQDARRIPPYYKERFDWEYVRNLLAAAWKEKMKFETPWIIRIAKHTDSLQGFRNGLAFELNNKKLRDFDRNVYTVLAAYLDKILPVLEGAKEKFVDYLNLKPGMNVMDLTEWYTNEEVQMVVIQACMEYILKNENDTKVGLPEAWKMLPQARNTPVKLYFEKFIREGATNNNYLVLDAQDLGGVDKTPLRQVSVWIMGMMMEANEVERLLKQTLGLKVPAKEIQTLRLGHFIVAQRRGVEKIYTWPDGVPKDIARKVARGELTPEYVRDQYLKPRKEDEDLVYKEKWEEEKRKREEDEKEFARQLERLSDLKAEEKVKVLRKQNEEMRQANLNRYHGELETANKKIEELEFELKDLKKFKDVGVAAEDFRQSFIKFIRLDEVTLENKRNYVATSEVIVTAEQPTLTVETIQKPLTLSQQDLQGRIAIVYAEGLLPSNKAFTKRQLHQILQQRFGINESYANFDRALKDFVFWGFMEKVQAGKRWDYRVKMSTVTAREKGLLKTH